VALIGVDDEEIPLIERETQRRNFYINILNEVENVLNKDDINSDVTKCFSWEVEFEEAYNDNNCQKQSTTDQHAVFGYPCSTRGLTESDGRNIDGTAKVGIADKSQCVFSHCDIGYYRKDSQCVKKPELAGDIPGSESGDESEKSEGEGKDKSGSNKWRALWFGMNVYTTSLLITLASLFISLI
ncbi:MAG: hypothetical protein EZS28_030533, partial [Streblomastix strix]